MKKRTYGKCELYLGDSIDLLESIDSADALITDPPYGVLLGQNAQTNKNIRRPYDKFDDSPEYIQEKVIPIINLALSKVKRGLITPGTRNCFLYPPPIRYGRLVL